MYMAEPLSLLSISHRTVWASFQSALLPRSNLREPRTQRIRQAGLNLRRDQAGLVEVLQVGFVLRPEAGELHANQVRQRDRTNAMERSIRPDGWRRLGIVRLYLLTRENQMDCSPRGGRSRLHQHVHSGNVLVLHPERLNRSRDPLEIVAPHRDIDIPREARRSRADRASG